MSTRRNARSPVKKSRSPRKVTRRSSPKRSPARRSPVRRSPVRLPQQLNTDIYATLSDESIKKVLSKLQPNYVRQWVESSPTVARVYRTM